MKNSSLEKTCEAIKKGEFRNWPKEVQKTALLETNFHKETPLHFAAARGLLGEIPEDLLTEESLLMPNYEDWTPLDLACANDHLGQIPKRLLTERTVLAADTRGHTVLHSAAIMGRLDEIPEEIVNEKNLLIGDKNGTTPLEYAAIKGQLKAVHAQVKISRASLEHLLDCEKISLGSREWIKNELLERKKQELDKALKNAHHPEL